MDKTRKMFEVAKNTMRHNPRCQVGAAVLASSGKIYGGVCFMSDPQHYCAERVALLKALSEGEKKIKSVLVTWPGKLGAIAGPCGICLNALWQLSNNPKLEIVLWPTKENKPVVKKIKDFYPYPYTE